MKKTIIITSIFDPTEAIKKFSSLPIHEYEIIVIGDKKSPKIWDCENVEYFSIEKQEQLGFELCNSLPYNHYCRKMLGYLVAISRNTDFIIDTDDDNIPKKNWGFPNIEGEFEFIQNNKGFINIYQRFSDNKIWPRGLPLNLINKDFMLNDGLQKKQCNIGVWQGLADEDPDVDAIYRLTSNKICNFNDKVPVVLGEGTITPFNSQNTLIIKNLFPLLYLPTYVTFRFTDILRGLIFQPIMWLYNYNLGFINATVIQKRNPHDYFKDFISEIPMYEHSEKVVEIVSNSITLRHNISDNLYNSYHSLLKNSIICDNEMVTLEAWLKDINNLL
jgi:hypothetical protein